MLEKTYTGLRAAIVSVMAALGAGNVDDAGREQAWMRLKVLKCREVEVR